MTPSIWSVLVIFVAAPLTLAALVTSVVLLTTSPSRRVVQSLESADGEESGDSQPPNDSDGADPASM